MNQETMETKNKVENKCPNCGSKLVFLPNTSSVKCVSCGSTFNIESLGRGKLDSEETNLEEILEKLKNANNKEVARIIHCEDCGALINLNGKTISTSCPFCGSNKVIEENKEEFVTPINGVIPFVITENDVKTLFKTWINKKLMAPRKLKKGKLSPSFSAFYIPFYTFDSSTYSSYTAMRGDYYYVTRTYSSQNGTRTVRERRIKWTPVSGNLDLKFDDVLVNGTSNVLNQFVEQIKSFDFTKMEKYQEQFLLGYYAERPSIPLDAGFNSAKGFMMNDIKANCRKQIGGDEVSQLSVKTKFDDVTFKEIMAPLYNGTYEFNKKKYKFVVNGQTGQFAGRYPISPLKISLIVLLVLIFVAILFIFIFYPELVGG